MTIRLANKKDCWQIAQLHQQEIKTGFLSSLNKKFLAKLYQAIVESNNGFCVVAESDNNKIVGFIAGSTNLNKFYCYFFKKHFLKAGLILLPKFFNFRTLRKIFETLFYPMKGKNLLEAELLTIAVKREFQGQGLAGLVFEKFVAEMRQQGVKAFKVLVGEKLKPAISFYEKAGFKFYQSVKIHRGEISRIYLYNIE